MIAIIVTHLDSAIPWAFLEFVVDQFKLVSESCGFWHDWQQARLMMLDVRPPAPRP